MRQTLNFMENNALKMLKQMVALGKGSAKHSPSPYMRWLDGHLIAAEEGYVEVEFEVRKDMCNPAGNLHGGVISGMMDEVLGIAVFSLNRNHFFTTINLNVDFLRPAKMGQKVVVKAQIERAGERVIHALARLENSKTLLAKSNSNLIVTKVELPQF